MACVMTCAVRGSHTPQPSPARKRSNVRPVYSRPSYTAPSAALRDLALGVLGDLHHGWPLLRVHRIGARLEAVLAPLALGEGGPEELTAGQSQLCRAVDRGGHPAQRLPVLVAVLAHPDVHLGERVEA